MLKNRHQPVNLFALVPQLGLHFEPQLQQLDRLLDDDELIDLVRSDLAKRYPRTRTRGRPSTPVEVILRMLVVMRLYSWSYAQTEFFVADSLALRQFCRVYLEKVPDDTTLIRWANTIGPETIEQINGRVVQLARSLKVTRGRKLRIDTTAVETNIHFPTDSGLIGDGVRVVSRLLAAGQSRPGRGRHHDGRGVPQPGPLRPQAVAATPPDRPPQESGKAARRCRRPTGGSSPRRSGPGPRASESVTPCRSRRRTPRRSGWPNASARFCRT